MTQMNNKTSLIKFLVKEWQKDKYTDKLQSKLLFIASEGKCWKITAERSEEVEALASTHEEADGRMLLHAGHAAEAGFEAVVICSEDTDVFVLCLAFSDQIHVPLFQKSGTQTRTKLIDIGKIAAAIGNEVCKALVGLHAFTGCDSVSAFAGKGKVRALELVKKNPSVREAFVELGENWTLTPELFER